MSGKKSTVNQDPVSQQKIWTEQLIKEAKLQKISTQFSLNPTSLSYITKKVTQIVPSKKPKCNKNLDTEDAKSLRNAIQQMELTPTKKFEHPVSTSMDYGWFVNNPEFSIKQAKFENDKENKPRWHYALSQTDITTFAQHYYLTMGTTLYSKPKTTNGNASK
eukprot:355056_1